MNGYIAPKGTRWRSPQILRDNKPAREGYSEEVVTVPFQFAVPLLIGKAHSELYEVSRTPKDPVEYADVEAVLQGLAHLCGHDWDGIVQAASQRAAALYDPEVEISGSSYLIAEIHSGIEQAALDLNDIFRFAAVLEGLWSLAQFYGVDWEEVEDVGAEKAAKFGVFKDQQFWAPLFEPAVENSASPEAI